ncbi:FtsB family cell division protein [Caldalkalibacillus mannanilyticus]|uniref:FtsB family cell division protein n=1 Tax=Caldalkalibacillus mannanilyticus TaxID=1418 RepID=UPI0004692F00|nr:septum formation initiator family protein [Caldalkalibacillus mannanilyticus]
MQPQSKTREVQQPPFSNRPSKEDHDAPMNKNKGKRRRMTLLAVCIIALIYWSSSVWAAQQKVIAEKQEELEALQVQVNQATEQQVELTYRMKRLEDLEYIAEVARREYFLSKPGELIFMVPKQ